MLAQQFAVLPLLCFDGKLVYLGTLLTRHPFFRLRIMSYPKFGRRGWLHEHKQLHYLNGLTSFSRSPGFGEMRGARRFMMFHELTL